VFYTPFSTLIHTNTLFLHIFDLFISYFLFSFSASLIIYFISLFYIVLLFHISISYFFSLSLSYLSLFSSLFSLSFTLFTSEIEDRTINRQIGVCLASLEQQDSFLNLCHKCSVHITNTYSTSPRFSFVFAFWLLRFFPRFARPKFDLWSHPEGTSLEWNTQVQSICAINASSISPFRLSYFLHQNTA